MNIATIKKRRDFINISKVGEKIFTRNFIFIYLYNPVKDNPDNSVRVGFTASKKIGNAPTRNRAKRRLRAGIRIISQKIFINSYEIILVARDKINKSNFAEIIEDLTYSFNKIIVSTK